MRYTKDNLPHAWVYHAERCEILKNVVWVDDVLMQYREYVIDSNGKPRIDYAAREIVERTVQAKKIVVSPTLVIINPLSDEEPACTESLSSAVI